MAPRKCGSFAIALKTSYNPWLAFAESATIFQHQLQWHRGNFKPSLWPTTSFKNIISMVLQWPLFEVAQYVLEILRSVLATGGRYEHRCYSVQGSTYNIYVSSTCLFHHAWYCLLCPKSLVPSIPTYDALPVDYTVMTTVDVVPRTYEINYISSVSLLLMKRETRLMRGKCYLTTWSSTFKSTETCHSCGRLSKQGGNATTMNLAFWESRSWQERQHFS